MSQLLSWNDLGYREDDFTNVSLATVRQWVATRDFYHIGGALCSPFLVKWKGIIFEDFFNYINHHLTKEEKKDFDTKVSYCHAGVGKLLQLNGNLARFEFPIYAFSLRWGEEEKPSNIFTAFPYILSINCMIGRPRKLRLISTLKPSFMKALLDVEYSQSVIERKVPITDSLANILRTPFVKTRFGPLEYPASTFPSEDPTTRYDLIQR